MMALGNGSGDRRMPVPGGLRNENRVGYVRRRLNNGLPVAFFQRSSDGESESDAYRSIHNFNGDRESGNGAFRSTHDFEQNRGRTELGRESQEEFCPTINVAREYLSCPICRDTCIESTSINCGHKFCKDCIEKWRKEKPVCPICSTLITSLHRLYSDDLILESQLNCLPAEVRQRFKKAQSERLEKLLQEQKSRNVMKRVRQKLDNSLTFFRCKNAASLEDRLSSASESFQNKMYMWISNWNVGLIIGIVLVGCFLLLANNIRAFSNFMQYLWLAIRNYDGVIPENWLKRPIIALNVKNATVSATQPSAIETIINGMDPFQWFAN